MSHLTFHDLFFSVPCMLIITSQSISHENQLLVFTDIDIEGMKGYLNRLYCRSFHASHRGVFKSTVYTKVKILIHAPC